MSSNYHEMSLQDWTEHINNRLDVIYKELCDYEETVTAQPMDEPEQVKLLDLLEAVNEIHKNAQSIHPKALALKQTKDDLHEQMELLQRSVNLLKLEAQTTAVEVDNAMQE